MPVSPTYPGVYVEEIDSGNRTIIGVATSITAFIGRAAMGPVNTPVTCFSYGDFENYFGGRDKNLPLTYAVEDFFLNGGSQAVIVRLYNDYDPTNPLLPGKFIFGTETSPYLVASSPGLWWSDFRVTFDTNGIYQQLATAGTAIITVNAVTANTALTFSVTGPNSGATAQTVTYTPSANDTPSSAAQGLATAFNALRVPGLAVATASGNQIYFKTSTVGAPSGTPALTTSSAGLAVSSKPFSDALNKNPTPGKIAALNVQVAAAHPALAANDSIQIYATPPGGTAVSLALWTAAASDTYTTGATTLAGLLAKNPALTATATGTDLAISTADPVLVLDALSVSVTNAGTSVSSTGSSFTGFVPAAAPTVDPNVAQFAANEGVDVANLFNVSVYAKLNNSKEVVESFPRVATAKESGSPLRYDRVLNQQSMLLRVPMTGNVPAQPIESTDFYGSLLTPRPGAPADATNAGGSSAITLDATGVGWFSAVARPADLNNYNPPLDALDYLGDQSLRTGIYALDGYDLFNLMCLPPDLKGADADQFPDILFPAAEYCSSRRAMLIIDPPARWRSLANQGEYDQIQPTSLGIGTEDAARDSAVYFPRVIKADVEMRGQLDVFPACGMIAGQFATTDLARGVWKAPAGLATGLGGAVDLEVNMTDMQNGQLNPIGINALRNFPIVGPVVWGSRTLRGADVLEDDYKYINVRRLTNYLEESLYRSTKWAVFEPNDEPLWTQLRTSINAFMADLARQGAFYGFSVQCDKTTTTTLDIDKGVVNVIIKFAPVKPAEFVVLQFQQTAGATPS